MQLKLSYGDLAEVIRVHKVKAGNSYLEEVGKWKDPEDVVELDLNRIPKDCLSGLAKFLKAKAALSDPLAVHLTGHRQITMFQRILADPKGEVVGTLQGLAQALRSLIEAETVDRMLYSVEIDGTQLLYCVSSINYFRADRDCPAHVTMRLEWIERGERSTTSETWYLAGVRGRLVGDLLRECGYALVKAPILDAYKDELGQYYKLRRLIGEQFVSAGRAYLPENRYGGDFEPLAKAGQPVKLVVDEPDTHKTVSGVISRTSWTKDGEDEDEDDICEQTNKSIALPVHPFVKCFDLSRHRETWVHVSQLRAYEYDAHAHGKLILPQEVKDLLGVLIEGTGDLAEDIVKGKTGGAIVMQTGPAGVGKTLSAEVYAEEMKRPLYSVQCAQLGISAQELETELQAVLARAARWRAILLLDEGDIYLRERGEDLEQNAIVGVFLRVLEYYSGVMFITSNRGDTIDDAILSRCIAHVKYQKPGKDLLPKIWETLAEQFGVPLLKGAVRLAVDKWPDASGRDVKNLLKLANILRKRRKMEEVTFDLLAFVSGFKT